MSANDFFFGPWFQSDYNPPYYYGPEGTPKEPEGTAYGQGYATGEAARKRRKAGRSEVIGPLKLKLFAEAPELPSLEPIPVLCGEAEAVGISVCLAEGSAILGLRQITEEEEQAMEIVNAYFNSCDEEDDVEISFKIL